MISSVAVRAAEGLLRLRRDLSPASNEWVGVRETDREELLECTLPGPGWRGRGRWGGKQMEWGTLGYVRSIDWNPGMAKTTQQICGKKNVYTVYGGYMSESSARRGFWNESWQQSIPLVFEALRLQPRRIYSHGTHSWSGLDPETVCPLHALTSHDLTATL